MKKIIVIVCLILAFIIIYFLQANFFSWFTIAGIKPNLFIILTLFISLFMGMKYGISFGAFCGIFLDIVLGKNLGTCCVMHVLVAVLGGYFDKNFSKDSRMTIILMVMASTFLFEIGCYIYGIIVLNTNIEIFYFARNLIVETIYNAILVAILYPFIQVIGYRIEEIFKGQKILTRYF